MEPVGAFLDEEWASLIRMFSGEESDSAAHWPSNEANMNNGGPVNEGLMFHFPDTFCSDLHHVSRESSNTSGSNNSVSFPTPSYDTHYCFTDSNHFYQETNTHNNNNHNSLDQTSLDFGVMDNGNNSSFPIFADNYVMEEILAGDEELGNGDGQVLEIDGDSGKEVQLKRKLDAPELHAGEEEKKNESATQTPKKKKSRDSGEAQKEKKKATWRKNQKLALHGNDEGKTKNAGANVQNSSCCSSEDDSSAFDHQELNNGGETSDSKLGFAALNSKGKTRASRGAATDPQSLYARKRRERINERLRILQNLVPNGTKVDISTMLEEAVHYVKFLQLQIKLLSSDDLWMYAPIAYNGMDIGLYRNISPTL